jgi:hypothetical protein
MEKQFITEARRLQKLAGIITESQINENNPLYGNDVEEFFRNLLDSYYEGFQEWDISDLDSTSDGGKVEKFDVSYDEFGDDYPYEDLDYDVEFEAEGPYDENERSIKGQVTVEPGEDGLLFSIYYSPEEVKAWDRD